MYRLVPLWSRVSRSGQQTRPAVAVARQGQQTSVDGERHVGILLTDHVVPLASRQTHQACVWSSRWICVSLRYWSVLTFFLLTSYIQYFSLYLVKCAIGVGLVIMNKYIFLLYNHC